MEKEIEELRARNEQLLMAAELGQQLFENNKVLKEENGRLESQNRTYLDEVTALRKRVQASIEEREECHSRISSLTKEVVDKENECKDLHSRLKAATTQIESLKEMSVELESTVAELDEERKRTDGLQKQNEMMRRMADRQEQKMIAQKDIAVGAEVQELRSKIQHLSSVQRTNQELRDRLARMEHELCVLQDEAREKASLVKVVNSLVSANKHFQQEQEQYKAMLKSANENVARLQAEVSSPPKDSNFSIHDAMVGEVGKQLEHLQAMHMPLPGSAEAAWSDDDEDAGDSILSLADELADVGTSAPQEAEEVEEAEEEQPLKSVSIGVQTEAYVSEEEAKLRGLVGAAEVEVEELKKRLGEAEASAQSLEQQRSLLELELDQVKTAAELAASDREQLKGSALEWEEELKAMGQRNTSLGKKLEASEAKVAKWKAKAGELDEAVSGLTADLKAAERARKERGEAAESALARVHELEEMLSASDGTLEQQRGAAAAEAKAAREAEAEAAKLRARVSELEGAVEEERSATAAVRGEMAAVAAALAALELTHAAHTKERKAAESSLARLRQETEALEEEKAALEAVAREHSHAHAALSGDLSQARAQLEALHSAHQKSNEELARSEERARSLQEQLAKEKAELEETAAALVAAKHTANLYAQQAEDTSNGSIDREAHLKIVEEMHASEEKLRAQIQRLNEEADAIKEEKATCERARDDALAESEELRVALGQEQTERGVVDARCSDLSAEVVREREKREGLESQLEASDRDHAAQLSALEERIGELEANQNAGARDVSSAQDRVAELQSEVERVRALLEAEEAKGCEARAEKAELERAKEELEKSLSEVQARLLVSESSLEKEKEAHTSAHEHAGRLEEALQSAHDELEQAQAEHRKDRERWEEEKENFELAAQDTAEEVASLHRQLSSRKGSVVEGSFSEEDRKKLLMEKARLQQKLRRRLEAWERERAVMEESYSNIAQTRIDEVEAKLRAEKERELEVLENVMKLRGRLDDAHDTVMSKQMRKKLVAGQMVSISNVVIDSVMSETKTLLEEEGELKLYGQSREWICQILELLLHAAEQYRKQNEMMEKLQAFRRTHMQSPGMERRAANILSGVDEHPDSRRGGSTRGSHRLSGRKSSLSGATPLEEREAEEGEKKKGLFGLW